MSDTEYVVKSLAPVRLAAKRATVRSQPEIAGFVGPAFGELADAVSAVGGSLDVAVAQYEMHDDGIDIVLGYGHSGPVEGAETVDLAGAEQAVCAVHLGPMDGIGASWQALVQWVEAQGWSMAGPGRENYVKAEPAHDQSEWVTELQQPVVPA